MLKIGDEVTPRVPILINIGEGIKEYDNGSIRGVVVDMWDTFGWSTKIRVRVQWCESRTHSTTVLLASQLLQVRKDAP